MLTEDYLDLLIEHRHDDGYFINLVSFKNDNISEPGVEVVPFR